jgi:peptidoglycan/xylan/chitin deacetylase (PgdA/CDA1 family)
MTNGHAPDAGRALNVTSAARPAEPGYDHGWFGYRPVHTTSAPAWPGDRPVAVAVVLDVRAAEWESVAPAVPVPGGRGNAPHPDYPRLSHREFGHRVGVWRLSNLLGDLGIPWTAVLDVLTAEHYGPVRDLVVDQSSQIAAGGLSASRPVTSLMVEREERDYVATTLARLGAALGVTPTSWMGPGWSQSARTPGILADAGVKVMLDWGNDDAPYPLEAAEPLWSVPVSWELTDVAAMFERDVEPGVYAESIETAVDVLARDGARTPRMLCLHLHPWLSGEAFRTRALRPVLARLAGRDDVWLATPEQMVMHVAGGI